MVARLVGPGRAPANAGRRISADVLFFRRGQQSKPADIDHAAIYLGDDWMIESSGRGVGLARLDWSRQAFAWAGRPLAEAGLEPAAGFTQDESAAA
jgi:hypothetical protein